MISFEVKNNVWPFEHSYLEVSKNLFFHQKPERCANPCLRLWNTPLASELGIPSPENNKEEYAACFSGNEIPEGAVPVAHAYAGHQFGHFTMLGDGRAIVLGEWLSPENKRFDLQLKGSGRTPFSRQGDGRATLHSVLREFLISEAMHYLGIPTTRSLAVTTTGEKVYRDNVHDGAVLTRISQSHIRIGTFEYIRHFLSQKELISFTHYVIQRHYPELTEIEQPVLGLIKSVVQRQIALITEWMRVGFIHGVMNTDNMSITGETIDYGPCAFLNGYAPHTAFSSIDRTGRYSFSNQPKALQWNLAVFADTLITLIHPDIKKAEALALEVIDQIPGQYEKAWRQMMVKKLGLTYYGTEEEHLTDDLLHRMEKHRADYTNTFGALKDQRLSKKVFGQNNDFAEWFGMWEKRARREPDGMQAVHRRLSEANPSIIPRNHLVEEALDSAANNYDFSLFHSLHKRLKHPYATKINEEELQSVPDGFDQSYQTFCGT